MKVIRSREFTAERAWDALDIANMGGVTVRLHWTDMPYRWHVNDGEEVFAVLDGTVEMHYRENGEESAVQHVSWSSKRREASEEGSSRKRESTLRSVIIVPGTRSCMTVPA